MNEWKVIGIASVIVNAVIVGLLLLSVFLVKDIVEGKNRDIAKLENELAELEQTLVANAAVEAEEVAVEDPVLEEAPIVKNEEPVAEQKAATVETKPAAPVQTDYKAKLASYRDSLTSEYGDVYYLFDGMPEDPYGGASNAEVTAMFERSYQTADAFLNKIYGILQQTLPADQFAVLQQEQRVWLNNLNKSKDSRLAAGGSSAKGDAMYELASAT